MICASLTIALGLLTFIGWTFGLLLLESVRAKYIPMARSTALFFSLIGVGANVPNADPSTTMFASWEWKCNAPVELV